MSDKASTTGTTQSARQVKYGLNVAIAIGAAVVLVVLVNWLAYERLYARMDLTATRQYSLSAQTRNVLGSLEGEYRIVTLFRDSGPLIDQVRDLVDEYARQSRQVTSEHINPDLDLGRRDAMNRQVREHFADEVAPLREAVELARDAWRGYVDRLPAWIERLGALTEGEHLPEGSELGDDVRAVLRVLRVHEAGAGEQMQRVDEAIDQALPDYVALREHLTARLDEDAQVLAAVAERFDRAPADRRASGEAKETLLRVHRELEPMVDELRDALRELRLAGHPEHYDEMLTQLQQGQVVVVLGPGQVRVIGGDQMYREVDPRIAEQLGEPEMRFLGEERLTGALISMSLRQPPLVVFVAGDEAALGDRGRYRQVAQRLRSANFHVTQWRPGGEASAQQGMMGQAGGGGREPEPPPAPAEGQRAVWVVLPQAASDRFGQANPLREQVAEHIERRIEAGDTALVILATEPGVVGGGDPLMGLLREWGVRPQVDRLVLQEVQVGGGQRMANSVIDVRRWPEGSPITRALAGMPGLVVGANPVVATAGDGLRVEPLVELRGNRMWAERNLDALEDIQSAPYDAAAARDVFTAAVAVEREGQGGRLVVVADPQWATDAVTQFGHWGEGTAELSGARFPANSELFVNSVYWLAGLDELIAASPRAQDLRRIEAMSDAALVGYRVLLLLGLPAAIALAGVGVWFVRRRG